MPETYLLNVATITFTLGFLAGIFAALSVRFTMRWLTNYIHRIRYFRVYKD